MAEDTLSILLADADDHRAERLVDALTENRAFVVRRVASLAAARRSLDRRRFDAVVTDLRLPDAAGIDAIRRIQDRAADAAVIALCDLGHGDLEIALEALRAGAQECLSGAQIDDASWTRALRFAVERKRMETERLRWANYDPLTGLPKLEVLEERFERTVLRAKRGANSATALLVAHPLNLDLHAAEFGGAAADDLLRSIGARLQSRIRKTDTVARLNRLDFVILIEGMRNANDLRRVAERAYSYFEEPFETEDGAIAVSAAIGAQNWRKGVDELKPLVAAAETAMLRQSEDGPGWLIADAPSSEPAEPAEGRTRQSLRAEPA